MDLDKLQKLSCLSLNETTKSKFIESLNGVVLMLKEIDALNVDTIQAESSVLTEFRKQSTIPTEKIESNAGLHLEDGFFLAPKVIIKD